MDSSKRNNSSLIDKITYLASLASKPQAIDPLLDPLRVITSRSTSHTSLSAADEAKLQKVYQSLEHYLINDDPLRSFTKTQLDNMIENQFTDQQPKRKMTVGLLIGAWGISISAALLAYTTGVWLPSEKRSLFSSVVFIAAIFTFAALFTLFALKKFKPELRRAYTYICFGIIAIGIASIQHPLTEMISGLNDHILLRFGGFTPAYIIGCVLFLLGALYFARLLSTKIPPFPIPLIVVSIIATIATVLAPHPALADNGRASFDLNMASLFICTALLMATAWILQRVIRQLSVHYAKAIRWFLIMTVVMALACSVRALWIMSTGDTTSLWSNFLFIIGSILMLQAGYKFFQAAHDH